MKAAVIYQKGERPQYANFPEPKVQNSDELLVSMKAVAIKHFDKGQASGSHYSSTGQRGEGQVIGGDGVCLLEDGTRVYAVGVSGMLAEKATIAKGRFVPLPGDLDDATAAALPNGVMGAAMGLKFKADIQPGEVVLINGATGFTGRIAVQIAKLYGAKLVIVTGRNKQSLVDLLELGADKAISVSQDDAHFKAELQAIHEITPIDVVIDYLWGHTAELIFSCLQGKGGFTNRIRYVSVGSMAGDLMQLSAASLRSVNLQLAGSGLGSWTKQEVGWIFSDLLPEMFRLAAEKKLILETVRIPLNNIADAWEMEITDGKRLVVTI